MVCAMKQSPIMRPVHVLSEPLLFVAHTLGVCSMEHSNNADWDKVWFEDIATVLCKIN
jgi:hypothetical protein